MYTPLSAKNTRFFAFFVFRNMLKFCMNNCSNHMFNGLQHSKLMKWTIFKHKNWVSKRFKAKFWPNNESKNGSKKIFSFWLYDTSYNWASEESPFFTKHIKPLYIPHIRLIELDYMQKYQIFGILNDENIIWFDFLAEITKKLTFFWPCVARFDFFKLISPHVYAQKFP